MHRGVYFGFARLPGDPKHAAWCKCVVNVGQRPTFADGDGTTVEVHALRDFGRDFYGEDMEVVVVGLRSAGDALRRAAAAGGEDHAGYRTRERGAWTTTRAEGAWTPRSPFQTGDE